MKCILTRRYYYRLTKKFYRQDENSKKNRLKSKHYDDMCSLSIAKRSRQSTDDRQFFSRLVQPTDIFFHEKDMSQHYHQRLIGKSDSSEIDPKETRFVACCIVSL